MPMKTAKRRFTYEERYAVWKSNGQRCWLCKEPLRIFESTIDHVLPEVLLGDDAARASLLAEYGLPDTFKINGYENWLPCHNHCNQRKANRPPVFVPGHKWILDGLVGSADRAARIEESLISAREKDKVFAILFVALEKRKLSLVDLGELLHLFATDPTAAGVPEDVVILSSGYWVPRSEIVREGICRCERNTCVGHTEKVHCYFSSSLSPWVVGSGLFSRCYDEFIRCPRCSNQHKRGHVGREGACDRPYRCQELQSD